MKSGSWSSYRAAGALGDDGPDDDGPEPKWPELGGVYELTIAVGYDDRTVVIDAPEEFLTIASDVAGSYYFEALPGYTPGVHAIRVRYEFQEGQGEAGSHDPGGDDRWFMIIDPRECEGREHRWTTPKGRPGVRYCGVCGVGAEEAATQMEG